AAGRRLERRAPLRRGPERRRRRLRRVLPAARRARGLRPPARPRGDDQEPASDVHGGRRRRRRARRRRRGRPHRRAGVTADSYYGRPILKEPVWKPEIPFYFFTGGLAGASSIL